MPNGEASREQKRTPWGLIVAIGCGGCLVVIVVMLLVGSSCVYGVFGLLKSSGAYKQSLARVQESPEVKEALGEPIEAGFWVMGSVNVQGSSGHADISFPIKGPKGEGAVYAVADKSEGEWTIKKLTVKVVETGQRIVLVEGDEPVVPLPEEDRRGADPAEQPI